MRNEDIALRSEFEAGARALGLIGRQKTLKPQQWHLADVLNAGNRFSGVLMPRRSSKTTTLLAFLIGRCLSREDYMAAYAVMTTAKKARDRFLKDVVPILERVYPDVEARPFIIRKSNGQERITFSNGSVLVFVGPSGEEFRSEAYDCIVLDEAGEASADDGEDVLSAALPTQDTRPGAMLVIAGTAGRYRARNLLWDELAAGRAGETRHGILDYSAEDIDADDLDAMEWEDVAPLLAACHPGIGTLTTLEAVEDNFTRLTRELFGREYLGIFGSDGDASGFLDYKAWLEHGTDDKLPEPPARFGLGVSVNLTAGSAAIVGAWRDEDGNACLVVLDHRTGSGWLGAKARELSIKYRTPIVYDSGVSTVQNAIEPLRRTSPRPQVNPLGWADVSAAHAQLKSDIDAGTVVHWNDDALNAAVQRAKKRGTPDSKRWAFGRITNDDDITPLEAAALALRAFDNAPKRQSFAGIIAA